MDIDADPPLLDIVNTIKTGRNPELDWIDGNAASDDIATALAAMANSQGGTLLIGVDDDDDGQQPLITGVDDAQHTIEKVLQAAISLNPKLVMPLPAVVNVVEKRVVVAKVADGLPHIYAAGGRYVQRKGAANLGLTLPELHQLLIERGVVNFEMETAIGATIEDIDWGKVQNYTEQLDGFGGQTAQEVLLKRRCLTRLGDELYPTNAGILLFGREPQYFVHSAEITAARFAGETMSDIFTRQDIIGTLPEQIRRAETFLIDNLRKGVRLMRLMARREQLEYPMGAARELVVNAVAHRDYSIKGDGIRMFLFKDHMEVSSPGGLPGPVTVENIREERFSRNPVIVQVLSDMGYIERLGYGVNRVIELMQQRELHEPEFTETGGGFRVVLYNRPSGQSVANAPRQDDNQTDITLNPRQEAALEYLNQPGNTRITNSDLHELFPDVHPETTRRDLADMVTKDILSKMGQKRGSYYVIKSYEE
jgi:ATP-dependent DNA helicase RecG